MLRKIISGGQTGADRGALDAALACGFAAGGFCPAGRKAEDGEIPSEYPLTAIEAGYRQRTKRNVEASDGTALFYRFQLTGGTALTLKFCLQQQKPRLLIDVALVEPARQIDALERFVTENNIEVLNVAGPRESSCPGMRDAVHAAIAGLIARAQ